MQVYAIFKGVILAENFAQKLCKREEQNVLSFTDYRVL